METRLIYEGGELAAEGPGGRYAVRAYGPADPGESEEEAIARTGVAHHDVEVISFRAVETEPEQQTYYGFGVYKVTPDGRLAWGTDWPFLGSAIAAALAMAEGAGVDEGAPVEELSSVDRARVEQMRDLDAAECDNCDWRGVPHPVVGDLAARVDPGGVVPAGECPECGALAYPARDRLAELVGALRILVEAETTIREALRDRRRAP